MANDLQPVAPLWRRLLSNHNPLYLFSAWLVLHGISQAFRGDVGLRWIPLMTQLLCGYTLAIALAGWLVVRVGKVWEDARMILLVVLLMFTALSTSYDDLCLKDPVAGAIHLGFGYCFSCAITECILFALGMKLPFRYRLPFYLQLAVLFAFPALLGKLSIEGYDPAMAAGVLLFPVVAGAALLTLMPAAALSPERENGTPWPWPFYPWSIFVFVAIASAIRAWMLSVSFSPAAGVAPSFLPYLLCPILLAMIVLALELGLNRKSKATQLLSLLALLAVAALSFPGLRFNAPQQILLHLLEGSLAGPPLLVGCAVVLIAIYALWRRATGSEFVVIVSLLLLACLRPETRSWQTLAAPNEYVLLALVAWQLGYGLWARSMPRLAIGGIALSILLGQRLNASWLFAKDAYWLTHCAILWCMLLPLFCRDVLAKALRATGPVWIMLVATVAPLMARTTWPSAPVWAAAAITTAMLGIVLIYLATLRVRWYVLAASWTASLAIVAWTATALTSLDDLQVRRGLTFYAFGLMLLGVALIVSLWKAGFLQRAWHWLQSATALPPPVSGNSPQ